MHASGKIKEKDAHDVALDYYSALDPVAVDVVSNEKANSEFGYSMSNREMCNRVMYLLGWEDIDLFTTHDFEAAYNSKVAHEVLAYALIAFLRMQVFREANKRKLGIERVNDRVGTHAEMWHKKLSDLWESLRAGEETKHTWNN